MSIAEQLIEEIIHDRNKGASELALAAMEILQKTALACRTSEIGEITRELCAAARLIALSRPSMAALATSTGRYIHDLLEAKPKYSNPSVFAAFAANLAADLRWEMTEAKSQTIINAANMLPSIGKVLTCSYSSTVAQSIIKAFEMGKRLDVIVLESLFNEISYGLMMSDNLGFGCTVISDDLTDRDLNGVELIIIGADLITAYGTLVNGYPTSRLLDAARLSCRKITVSAVFESAKIISSPVQHLEPGFDEVPLTLVDRFITENGIVGSTDINEYLRWVNKTRPVWNGVYSLS